MYTKTLAVLIVKPLCAHLEYFLTGYVPTLPLQQNSKIIQFTPEMSVTSTTKEDRFRLNDTNWVEWRAYVEGKLLMSDLDVYLEPPTLDQDGKPAATPTADEIRKAKETAGFICMHLTRKFLDMTEQFQTAHELWSALKNPFQKAEKNVKLLNIQKLVQMAKDPPPIEDLALTIRSVTAKIGDVRVDSDTFMVGFYTALLPPDLSDLRLLGLTSTKQ